MAVAMDNLADVGGKPGLAAQDIQNQKTPHGLTRGPLKGATMEASSIP